MSTVSWRPVFQCPCVPVCPYPEVAMYHCPCVLVSQGLSLTLQVGKSLNARKVVDLKNTVTKLNGEMKAVEQAVRRAEHRLGQLRWVEGS